MPTPFVTTHYMNRFLNPGKLAEIKYCNIPASMSLKDFNKKYRMPDKNSINIKGEIRLMLKKDASAIYKLFNDAQQKYQFKYKFTQEDILHYLLPKPEIVWTWVIENEIEGKKQVTDFFAMHRMS